MFENLKNNKIIIVTGHYGSGKTNLAVNIALSIKDSGNNVSLIDFDIVNPYFRAADSAKLLTDHGVRCIIPVFANSNIDIPALPPDIYSVFDPANDEIAVFDVGGDDAGAIALGMYREQIQNAGYEMLYVINDKRPLTMTPEDAVSVLREIESTSGLFATGIINNSNLGAESELSGFTDSFAYADNVSSLTALPLIGDSTCLYTSDFASGGRNIINICDYTKNIYGGLI